MEKDFDSWNGFKKNLDKNHKPPLFREREIWWCSIGINVGYEIFGKGSNFTRPVLVLKKYSAFSFFGIPLTSQTHKANHFTYHIDCKGKPSLLLLSQIRIFDARRLYGKLEKINENEFDSIKNKIIETHFK